MVVITADFPVAQDHEKAAGALLAKLAAAVASEPGNIRYDILKFRQSPPVYRVYEVYRSDEAFEAHKNSDHLKTILREFRKLLTGPAIVTQYDFVASA